MRIVDFIKELKQKEIEISFLNGKLKYKGPEEHITPEIIEKLKKYKHILIKYFWLQEQTNLMPINTEGDKIPIFIIHGNQGNYPISEYLGHDQPVYGFFHYGSEGDAIPFKSVKEMAKKYLEKILAFYSSGPYYLIGQSFGGILAFEMAVQLQNSNREVPYLVLIDCNNPSAYEPLIKWQGNIIKTIREEILESGIRKLKAIIQYLICNSYILINKPIPVTLRIFYVYYKYEMLAKKYRPEKFKGDILLFKTSENDSSYKYLGWEKVVDNIKLINLDSKHTTIFDDKKSANIVLTEIKKYLAYINKLK